MIDETSLVPNSHKSKEQKNEIKEPKVKQVASGRTRKKPLGKRLLELFVDDDVSNVKEYMIYDVVIPAVKDGFLDFLNTLFYGRSTSRRSRVRGGNGVSYISYNSISSNNKPQRNSNRVRRSDYQDIILDTRGEAEDVLEMLNEILDKYKEVSIADLYDACGITGTGYTDNQFGWDDLHAANIRRVHEGYLLDLPRPIPLD